MQAWSRRQIETLLLAALATIAVVPLRFHVESRMWFLAELTSVLLALIAVVVDKALCGRWVWAGILTTIAAVVLGAIPVAFAIATRIYGSPIAFEMSLLATFGSCALAIAAAASTNRLRSMSLIISGFLVLFCTSISDSRSAALLPLVWMLGCVWHLIANHWERLDVAMPESVQRNWTLRPAVMIATLLVLCTGAYAVKDRMLQSHRFSFGIMPTSGGSVWSDPAARSGVGSGDAAIAGKDHAESFGAVDSDIFLESTESSLFDMVNDMFGEPKQRSEWERRQAMANDNIIPMHERAAKSEQGGGTFATERMPPKQHRHFNDAKDASVVQWDGPTGIRLAMQRYDTFDGSEWSQTTDLTNDKLTRVEINQAPWFFDPQLRDWLSAAPDDISIGLLKVIRLQTQRLPVPMMTAGIHIKEVDRQDFFGLCNDGSFWMPGREKVPPLTVLHVASVSLTEDEIRAHLRADGTKADPSSPHRSFDQQTTGMFERLVQSATAQQSSPFDQLTACAQKLRTEFTLDRAGQSSADSIAEFLETRHGGNHLFATSAAVMARQLGLRSRLVTGFYVRPDAFDLAAGHASVLPRDVHVWAEVQLNDGRWFEIEATPGYQPPHYQPSWRLLARQFIAAQWPLMAVACMAVAGIYVTRSCWIDWSLTAVWMLAGWLRPQRQIRLAIRIIEVRARLAGQPRPPGKSQRAWLEQLTKADTAIGSAVQSFCDSADAIFFGNRQHAVTGHAASLIALLQTRTIHTLNKEATS